MLDAKLIKSFVERAEGFHRQRQDLDARLALLYREARDQRLDVNALKSLVRDRHRGDCADDLVTAYRALAKNAPPEIKDDGLDFILSPSA